MTIMRSNIKNWLESAWHSGCRVPVLPTPAAHFLETNDSESVPALPLSFPATLSLVTCSIICHCLFHKPPAELGSASYLSFSFHTHTTPTLSLQHSSSHLAG